MVFWKKYLKKYCMLVQVLSWFKLLQVHWLHQSYDDLHQMAHHVWYYYIKVLAYV